MPDNIPVGPYDIALSALRGHVEDAAVWITIWQNRTEPDTHARRCASGAVDAIDALLRQLYMLRGRLVSDVRRADDAAAARADALLRQRRDGTP